MEEASEDEMELAHKGSAGSEASEGGMEFARQVSAGSEYRRYKQLTHSLSVSTTASTAGRDEEGSRAALGSTPSLLGEEGSGSGSEDELDPEILRGVPLSYVLRGAGGLWRTSPVDRAPGGQREIHRASRRCLHLDAFISQTWQTPGWQRHLALLLQYHWRRAAVVGLLANAALLLLDAAGRLPTLRIAELASAFPVDVRRSLWCPIPALLSLAALVLGPSLPGRADPTVFFDAVCINQTDTKAKMKGVYNLNEFLEMSSELVALWTPEYLERMWCVYELAFFCAKKDISKITVIPVVQQNLRFFFLCVTGLMSFLPRMASALGRLRFGGVAASLWLRLGSLLLVRFCVSEARGLQRLSEQFDSFDIRRARCREPFDRTFVLEGVVEWYGSEDDFNRYAQGPLKSKVMAASAALGMTYRQLLGAMAPLSFSLASQIIGSLAQGRGCRARLMCASLWRVVHLGVVCPMCFKLHIMAATLITRCCRSAGSEWAFSVAVAMLLSRAFELAQGELVWSQKTPARACGYVPAALLAARAVF